MNRHFFLRNLSSGDPEPFILQEQMTLIGCSPDNDIVLEDITVGQCAAKIEFFDDNYSIESIGSNRILLNNRKTHRSRLSPGDNFMIGAYMFIFDEVEAPAQLEDTTTVCLTDMYKLISSIGIERDLNKLLKKLVDLLTEVTRGTEVFVFILDYQQNPQVFISNCSGTSEKRFSDTIVQEVLTRGEGLCIPNVLSDPAFKDTSSVIDLKLHSVICSPVKVAGNLMGLIYVGSKSALVSFSENDLITLNLYATITGMVIRHVDYISQQSKIFRKFTTNITYESIIAESKAMKDVLDSVSAIASSDITVLLSGETGTGKTRIAEIIHQKSNRATKPFLVLNCSALHGELLESEMFGHKKGSFTGAFDDHKGIIAAANGGTLFLDEIGEMEPPLQAKLLRTLETGLIRPIGYANEIAVNVRFICATHRDLQQMAKDGTFRMDLFYRINQFLIEIPPLRKRGGDLLLLAYVFLEQYKNQYPAKNIFDFHPDTLQFINNYYWPGNIRELSNFIHSAFLRSNGTLVTISSSVKDSIVGKIPNFQEATKNFQKELLQKAIETSGGDKDEAAKSLGLPRSTFYRYQAQLGL